MVDVRTEKAGDMTSRLTASEFAVNVDQLLAEEAKVADETEVCAVLAAGVLGDVARSECVDCVAEVLSDSATPRHKTVLTASLLRLLAHHSAGWIHEVGWRQRVFNYLDTNLPQRLLAYAEVSPSQQTHEKLSKIATAVDAWDDRFRKAVSPLRSLDSYRKQRERIMAALNEESGAILIQPFITSDWESGLRPYFAALEKYVEVATTADAVRVRNQFLEATEDLRTCLQKLPSRYSNWLLEMLCVENLQLFDREFAANPCARPAHLEAAWSSKKYKLYEVDAQLEVRVRIANHGPGLADGVHVSLEADAALELDSPGYQLGSLPPGKGVWVAFSARVVSECATAVLELTVTWHDFNGAAQKITRLQEAECQNPSIAWEDLEGLDPYSLDPIDAAEDLVGRKELLDKLKRITSGKSMGSAIIYGQKRVGKTSIARVYESQLQSNDCVVGFIEAGQVISGTPAGTVERLGEKLCRAVQRKSKAASTLEIPDFERHGLSALDDFLDGLDVVQPESRFMFIIDEFDSLPSVLYSRDLEGDAFFESLRSASSRKNVGFLLVGGEKMNRILEQQGMKVNKWVPLKVDYFQDWNDFEELVTHPTRDHLEFSQDALELIFRETAGNPYFTNLVCEQVVKGAVRTRDGHVTAAEMERALSETAQEVGVNSFQHFWEDGIIDTGAIRDEKSLHRRKVIIAVHDACVRERPASLSSIEDERIARAVPVVEAEMRELVSRDVLVEEPAEHFSFKVPLFERWLGHQGISAVITADVADAAAEQRLQREKLKVASGEIDALLKTWGKRYRGEMLSEDVVLKWLRQFGGEESQRVMFSLLQATRFITWPYLGEKMDEVDRIVRRDLKRVIGGKQRKQSYVVVSCLDGVAKSGMEMGRLYADRANVYLPNVVETSGIMALVKKKSEDVKVVLFLDDFVGTGTQAKEYLKRHEVLIRELGEQGLRTLFVTVIAHTQGAKALERFIERRGLGIEFHALEFVSEDDRVFRGKNTRFKDVDQRREAERICAHWGQKLEARHPMGYGDLELALVLERGCPNNSLPVLWSDRTFEPIFHRR